MLKVGDQVFRTPSLHLNELEEPGKGVRFKTPLPIPCTVVFVHPRGRFHTVEFRVNGHAVRESFRGVWQ